jgi:hypothetical protein
MKSSIPFKSIKRALAVSHFLALAAMVCPLPAAGQGPVEAWVQRYHEWASGDNMPLAIAVSGNGNVVVTGTSADEFGLTSWLTVACASSGDLLWTQSYHGPVEFTDEQPNAVAVDAVGNAYVTGVIWVAGNQDYLTLKYSSNGVPMWLRHYNGTGNGNDGAIAIVLDAAGNIIVTGLSTGTSGLGNFFDCVTIKYSPEGAVLWTNRYNGPGNKEDSPVDVAVDAAGNVFVTGSSETTGGDFNYLNLALTSDGEHRWVKHYNGPGDRNDFARAMTVDRDGNVFATGFSDSGGDISNPEYATVSYSPAGDLRWTNRYHANELQHGFQNLPADIAVDAAGNVFVTGGAGGYATIKYSNAGEQLWTRTYNGPVTAFGHNDNARALAIDGNGNVIVTGSSQAENPEPGVRDWTTDMATIAYSNAGEPLWTQRYNGPANGDDVPLPRQSLALGPDGSVYVTGASDGDSSEGKRYDFVIVKYAAPRSAPPLEIAKMGGNVILSWPVTSGTFYLEQSTDLGRLDPWSPVNRPTSNDGSQISVSVPVDIPRNYFRLSPP